MDVVYETFGAWLRAQREARRFTQEDLMEKLEQRSLGVTKSAVSGWENDKFSPSGKRLSALWAILLIPEGTQSQVILAMNDRRFPFPGVAVEPIESDAA